MRSLLIPALLTALACTGRQMPPPGFARAALTFIENDLPGALAQAQAEGKPLFVDAWAPW